MHTVATAFEMYQADKGEYPVNFTSLVSVNPPYLNSSDLPNDLINQAQSGDNHYCLSPIEQYSVSLPSGCEVFYKVSFGASGYTLNYRDNRYGSGSTEKTHYKLFAGMLVGSDFFRGQDMSQ